MMQAAMEIMELYKENNEHFVQKYIRKDIGDALSIPKGEKLPQFEFGDKSITFQDMLQLLSFVSKSINRTG